MSAGEAPGIPPQRFEDLARSAVLLVASDYDGTLAPIVDNPDDAFPQAEAIAAIHRLVLLGNTHVAVISGRSLDDLRRLADFPPEIRLVGSHGGEFDSGFRSRMSTMLKAKHADLLTALEHIAAAESGLQVETKPASVALHYRLADTDAAERTISAIETGPGSWPGIFTRHGKMVVELAVIDTGKGIALQTLREDLAASCVLFIGDDVTDEDAFATLGSADVGVKVGPGDSLASYRLGNTTEVAKLLTHLAGRRESWLSRTSGSRRG